MQLYDANGYAFKLTLVGYQFPEMTREPYDSNWLMIEVDVTTPHRSWRASDPCLLSRGSLRSLKAVTASPISARPGRTAAND
jgi:hypothetical protein